MYSCLQPVTNNCSIQYDEGTYIAPSKMTVAQWLDIGQADYLKGVKPSTISSYQATIKNHIKPGIGAIRLNSLTTHDIQEFYNKRFEGEVCGLQWECVDFDNGTILIDKQLQSSREKVRQERQGKTKIRF